MQTLLFLSHRIPYPPNKGDKIRSFNLLKFLAQRYRVVLGAFVDDPADWAHAQALSQWCEAQCLLPLNPMRARLSCARSLLSGQALTLGYYRSKKMQRWVDEMIAQHDIAQAVLFSSPMAQYVLPHRQLPVLADFCDLDSAKWTQYAGERPWPLSWVYRTEGKRLLAYERAVARTVGATTLVTPAEVALFTRLAPEVAGNVHAIGNGVDTQFFAPDEARASPFTSDEVPLVFTGAMDYWPNVDAVSWFARDIFPKIAAKCPAARFYIVGMNPTEAARALARERGVVVTGRVEDVRPFVQHARAVVAPLRIARGVQNKVLEAMALARPVVVSGACASGVGGQAGQDYRVADDAEDFARQVLEVINPEVGAAIGKRARSCIVSNFAWEACLAPMDTLLNDLSGRANALVGVRGNSADLRKTPPSPALQEMP